MCRKSALCELLGNEPSAWSKRTPLPPPNWFEEQLVIFHQAANKAAIGDRAEAIQALKLMRSDEMRAWFDEHGQMSGKHRAKQVGVADTRLPYDAFDPVRSAARFEKLVFERDSYTCRYCGLRLVAKEVLKYFEKAVGASEFRTQGTNAQQHGVIHAFKIVADHVVPHTRGGKTDVNNLVASCPACNYGKEAYTIEELGIEDPRSQPPANSGWDGLISLLAGLKKCNQVQ
jgi:5-methylcytosine-specific restriction endonuclease McrA